MTGRAIDGFVALIERSLAGPHGCYVVLGPDGPADDVALIRATGVVVVEEPDAGVAGYVMEGDPAEWPSLREAALALFPAVTGRPAR